MKKIESAVWENINSIDLSFLQERMLSKYDWSTERTTNALKRYKQYLYIVFIEPNSICPTKDVDEVWHQHILHTRLYEEHCHKIFGKMLHHEPFKSGEEKQIHKTFELSTLGPEYFGKEYPKATDEDISRECCSQDSECCSTTIKVSVE